MQWNSSMHRRGGVLITSCILVMVFMMIGAALCVFTIRESRAAEQERDDSRALALAEAGLERALLDLRLDLVNDPDYGNWTDGMINGTPCHVTTDGYSVLAYTNASLGTGAYAVELRAVAGRSDAIWVRVTGNSSAWRAAVQTYARARDLCPWNNAIYAGVGGGGSLITGHVRIAGSVHILGDNLEPGDVALDMTGSSAVVNTYERMPAELLNAVPPLPTTVVDGKTVETLNTEFRVRDGLVTLDGFGTIGQAENYANLLKETLDGVFTNDGFDLGSAATNVYSDNGMDALYDLGDVAEFPSLSDPYDTYPTYLDYLRSVALVITDASALTTLSNIKPKTTFSYTDPDGKGSISMSGGEITIDGIVFIDGDLGIGKPGASETITYTGRGTLVVTGDVKLSSNFYPKASDSYPSQSVIGLMTPKDIVFSGAQTKVAGLFYAEDKIISKYQTTVAGTFVSNFFDMGPQTPSIYQVPTRRRDLPPGLIGSQPNYVMTLVFWERLPVEQDLSDAGTQLPVTSADTMTAANY